MFYKPLHSLVKVRLKILNSKSRYHFPKKGTISLIAPKVSDYRPEAFSEEGSFVGGAQRFSWGFLTVFQNKSAWLFLYLQAVHNTLEHLWEN